jgi:hypothetical protein
MRIYTQEKLKLKGREYFMCMFLGISPGKKNNITIRTKMPPIKSNKVYEMKNECRENAV